MIANGSFIRSAMRPLIAPRAKESRLKHVLAGLVLMEGAPYAEGEANSLNEANTVLRHRVRYGRDGHYSWVCNPSRLNLDLFGPAGGHRKSGKLSGKQEKGK